MVGRKDDKDRLIDMLVSDNTNINNNLGVVAILGIGVHVQSNPMQTAVIEPKNKNQTKPRTDKKPQF